MSGKKRLIGAIDQGTTSTRFFLFDDCGQLIPGNQGQKQEFKQITREPGWLEHDPIVILNTVKDTMDAAMVNFSAEDIAGIGVTNQRETTVLWDKFTGEPLHNAVVWSDTRTTHLVDRLKLELDENVFKSSCGLPLANYFSAMKIRWLMDNEPKVQQAIERKRCMFGTIDTWIIWNLTGGPKSGVHVTDISNASRTMLMNLQTLKWDPRTCNKLGIPMEILPEIKPSSAFFGKIAQGPLAGVPIYGCIGDQQAATLGQLCLKPGTSKGTYGTGCFILTNTGHDILFSNHGMLTTALFQLGEDQKPFYAIEGSVASCGSVIEWLKNNLEVLPKKGGPDINEVASSVNNTGDVFFVNAFSGLFAPRWRADARGTIVGMTSATTKAHICRAVMESITFSTREVCGLFEPCLNFYRSLMLWSKIPNKNSPFTKLMVESAIVTFWPSIWQIF
eukprot:TRINITY_DN14415_c0_g1_i10.p1 TRINITY_DN14415_c0_g1~~TRINITY_DN14415_c0_g1_i10.p1  ORF type:complete len:447 (-),score=92.78 TRINITY_DN14415_c0_g1_i10:1019-2359(-)